MKKFVYPFLFIFFISYCFSKDYSHSEQYSKNVPLLLQGIWQGNDRLAFFSSDDSVYTCILRVFYKWYDDRAAESEQYTQISTRDKNNTIARNPENIEIEFKTFIENKTSGAYEIKIKYPGQKEFSYIPFAIINGQLYLNFFLRSNYYTHNDETETKKADSNKFFLIDMATASGITISPPLIKKELLCCFVDGHSIYQIRYWLSDMDEIDADAEFSDGNEHYFVKKYIQNSGNLYTCTTGRSSRIRNIQKSSSLPYSFIINDDETIYAYGKPYLVYVPGTGTLDELNDIVKENNSKRHPPQKPLFPVSQIDFHWKEITDLEKYNPYTWNKRNLDIHK